MVLTCFHHSWSSSIKLVQFHMGDGPPGDLKYLNDTNWLIAWYRGVVGYLWVLPRHLGRNAKPRSNHAWAVWKAPQKHTKENESRALSTVKHSKTDGLCSSEHELRGICFRGPPIGYAAFVSRFKVLLLNLPMTFTWRSWINVEFRTAITSCGELRHVLVFFANGKTEAFPEMFVSALYGARLVDTYGLPSQVVSSSLHATGWNPQRIRVKRSVSFRSGSIAYQGIRMGMLHQKRPGLGICCCWNAWFTLADAWKYPWQDFFKESCL